MGGVKWRGGQTTCPAPPLFFYRQSIYLRTTQGSHFFAFFWALHWICLYVRLDFCVFFLKSKRKIKKDLALNKIGCMFPLMGNNNEHNVAGGCLKGLSNLLFIGLVFMFFRAWATHSNAFIRLTFWIFIFLALFCNPNINLLDPEPRKNTIEWYEWKAKHMN